MYAHHRPQTTHVDRDRGQSTLYHLSEHLCVPWAGGVHDGYLLDPVVGQGTTTQLLKGAGPRPHARDGVCLAVTQGEQRLDVEHAPQEGLRAANATPPGAGTPASRTVPASDDADGRSG